MLCHRFFRSHAITFTATGLTGYHHLAAIIHKDFNWPATNDFATLCHPQCKRIWENSTMQVQGVLQRASNRFISVLLNKLCLCLHNDWNWPWALRNWKRFKLSCQRRTCCAEIGSARKWHPGNGIREASPINQKAGGSLTNHMETILVCLKNEQTLISKD